MCTNNHDKLEKCFLDFKTALNTLQNDEIVCLDETAFVNNNNPVYGYFSKGRQPKTTTTPKRVKVSLLMAIHPNNSIVAKQQYPTALNSSLFQEFLKNELFPNLPSTTKAVIMDNVSFHKTKAVIELFNQHNITPLFIPPYSPRCNPIEEVFSVIKRYFRCLPDDLTFYQKIDTSLEYLKVYKAISNNYHHTRKYVEDKCRK